jgi:hypothetical protein
MHNPMIGIYVVNNAVLSLGACSNSMYVGTVVGQFVSFKTRNVLKNHLKPEKQNTDRHLPTKI